MNKSYIFYLLLAYFGFNIPTALALNCTVVAKIQKIAAINEIIILRAAKNHKPEHASRYNRELCADDVVIVPKSISWLQINYYSTNSFKQILKYGDKYTVIALAKPCGKLCKFKENLKIIIDAFKETKPPSPIWINSGYKGTETSQSNSINMPLAADKDANSPFYLFARDGAIPISWIGGQAPYQVKLVDSQENIILQESTKDTTVSLNITDTEPDSKYVLTIQSGNEIYEKTLEFRVPPFPLNPNADQWITLARLLANSENNWRLEIWRQLSAMPDSKEKRNFMGHLEADQFNLCEFGLCE
jgi:hypothetical protein